MRQIERYILRPLVKGLCRQVGQVKKVRGLWRRLRKIPAGAKLYVGSGNDRREGFLGCDLRPLGNVDLMCKAWNVSRYCSDLEEIYSRHMLEHLTFDEVNATLNDWFEALALGGRLHLVVPNFDFHIEQWRRAEWSEEALRDKDSEARCSFAGLFGWQRDCKPGSAYAQTYWDVHKSGYNEKLITFLLERTGFDDVEVTVENDLHLVARALKRTKKGERQVGPTLENIRADHRARYEFAATLVPENAKVLDLACGVGYGAKILSDRSPVAHVLAADIDEGAITYAMKHYQTPKVQFQHGDALKLELPSQHFDVAISFETIEHLTDAPLFLSRLREALRPGGMLICSVPNQQRLPFNPKRFKYHLRHYTPIEMEELLTNAGFVIEQRHTQSNASDCQVRENWDGDYNIAVCRKAA